MTDDDDYKKGSVDTTLEVHEQRLNGHDRKLNGLRDDVDENSKDINSVRHSVVQNDDDIETIYTRLERIETAFDDRISGIEKWKMYVMGGLAVLMAILGFAVAIVTAVLPSLF